jgi:hypothetical protein
MELTNKEIAVLEQTRDEALRDAVRELNAIELALIGGGIGDVIVG